MENEKWSTKLYEKMSAEQDSFRDWLKSQPPETILNHAYEYSVREDILMAMELHDLTDEQAKALLSSPAPLGDVFHFFEKIETDHMDIVWDCVEIQANDIMEDQQRALKETPVYPQSAIYAREHGELEQYRASHKANVACKQAIEDAIREHYHNNCLDKETATQVIGAFGMDRTLYVLAATVRDKDWDGRISQDNKAWAKTIPVFADIDFWGSDRNADFVVNASNPGLTDVVVSQARQEYALLHGEEEARTPQKGLTSVRKNLRKKPPETKRSAQKRHEPER